MSLPKNSIASKMVENSYPRVPHILRNSFIEALPFRFGVSDSAVSGHHGVEEVRGSFE